MENVDTTVQFAEAMSRLVHVLDELEKSKHLGMGFTSFPHAEVTWRRRGKYAAIDFGVEHNRSGAFLVEIATGELYNIKGYGVPDKNKKKKADIGNIYTVDPAWLHSRRWNYLR